MGKKKKQQPQQQQPSTPTTPPAPLPIVTGGWKVALALAFFGMLLYAGTMEHGFTLDDVHVVRENPVLALGDWGGAVTSSYWPAHLKTGASNWRPLANVSWLIDRVGIDAAGMTKDELHTAWASRHHLMNALLHGLAVLLCFPVARRLLGSVSLAWLATLLFAVHPAHTEVVGPIVGRTDLLAGIGALAMCAAFWRRRDGGGPAWLAGAALAFALGLGGKESAAPVLLVLPLADLWLYRRPWRSLLGRPALDYLPFVAVAVVYLIARTAVLGGNSLAHSQAADLGVMGRVAFTGHNSWISAWLLALPVRFHHVITTVPSDAPFTYPPPTGVWLLIWPVVLVPLWFGWVGLVRRAPFAALCWVAVLLPWLPTSGMLPAAAGVSLRFLFISTAFASVGVVAAGRAWWRAKPGARDWLLGAAAVWAVAATVITVGRVPAWENDGTFHEAVLEEVPGCYTSAYSRGAWLAMNGGDMNEARRWFEQAVAVAGDSDRGVNARNNLATSYEYGPSGVRYGGDADLDRALAIYTETLRVKPDSSTAAINAAIVCDRLAERHAATPARSLAYLTTGYGHWRTGASLQPDHPDARSWHRRSAQIALQLNQRDAARRHYREAAVARRRVLPLLERMQGPDAVAREQREAEADLNAALQLGPPPDEAKALRKELQAWRSR